MRATAQQGFGLLEAIVAMAILGSAGLLLFAWIHSSLETAQRLRDAEARARLQIEVQAWVAKLNPMIKPKGEERLADVQIRWQARLVEPALGEYHYGEPSATRWQVGLYEVAVEASQGGTQSQWTQLIAGWRAKNAGPAR